MIKNLLFEIGVEEIPARFISKTKKDILSYLQKKFEELNIEFQSIDIKATPRRLAIFINGLAEMQKSTEEESKGPAKRIAFDDKGEPSKALLGFLKGKDAEISDIFYKTSGKEEYVYVKTITTAGNTLDMLQEIFEGMIRSLTFPKSMRWGGKNLRFVRPIRWLLCLADDKVVDFEIEGIKTSNITKGHRFLGSGEIVVNQVDRYGPLLRENYVILDDEERKSLILDQCQIMAASLGGKIVEDEELLEEITYIVEYPTAFYGEFSPSYLTLPPEVIITPMKEHQRYFPLVDDQGKLLNKFISVRNGNDQFMDNVKRGNEKVLDARLSDALFFFTEDVKKPLESYVEKLDTIVFQQQLGTIRDKVNRIQKLAEAIAQELNVQSTDLSRAALLSKADLTTAMVFEFPELQGIMGRYYSGISKETAIVGEAIYEHYLPRFAGDEIPQTMEGTIVSLADKMDSLAGFFAIDIQPTGSQDPYALRRQALGVLSILIGKKLPIPIEKLIKLAIDNLTFLEFDKEKVAAELSNFFRMRLKNYFIENGLRYDVVDAIIYIDSYPYDLEIRGKELDQWVKNHDIQEALNTFNRVSNIVKSEEKTPVNVSLLLEPSEKQLWEKFQQIEPNVQEKLQKKEYIQAIELVVSLKGEIDNFFDSVMVMDENLDKRQNRLSMLYYIKALMLEVADISKLVA